MLDITYKFNLKYIVDKEEGLIYLIKKNGDKIGELKMTYSEFLEIETSVETLAKFGYYIKIEEPDLPYCVVGELYKASLVQLVNIDTEKIETRYYHQFIDTNFATIVNNTPTNCLDKKITISMS